MRKLPLSVLVLAPLLALGIYACDQQPVEPEVNVTDQQQDGLLASHAGNTNPLVGTWRMRSAVVGSGELFVGSGLRYIMTLRRDLSHSVSVSNDVGYLVCPEPQTSCGWDGTYTPTLTTITTLEPNHPKEDERGYDTSSYARCGRTLIFMDHGDEGGFRLTFQRTGQR